MVAAATKDVIMRTMALKRYSVFVSLATLFLIVAGGLVTSTGSGLSVPDWPLSFGQWMPPMEGGVFYEHGHRMIASAVGLFMVILAVWVWVSKEISPLARKLALAGVILVVFQGILGGVTVLLKLPVLVSVLHAAFGQIFFTITVCLAVVLRGENLGLEDPKARRLAWMTVGFVFLQLILGAIYRHSGAILHAHMTGAALVLIHVVLLWKRTRIPLTTGLLSLVGAQIVLGLIAWQFPYVMLTTAHVAIGALLLAGTSVLTLKNR